MYRLDCDFCAETVESRTVDTVKSRAETHLTEDHPGDVLTALGDSYDDVPCHNDCGYAVPVDGGDVAGVECPRCGHDNFRSLLKRYVYWRITEA